MISIECHVLLESPLLEVGAAVHSRTTGHRRSDDGRVRDWTFPTGPGYGRQRRAASMAYRSCPSCGDPGLRFASTGCCSSTPPRCSSTATRLPCPAVPGVAPIFLWSCRSDSVPGGVQPPAERSDPTELPAAPSASPQHPSGLVVRGCLMARARCVHAGKDQRPSLSSHRLGPRNSPRDRGGPHCAAARLLVAAERGAGSRDPSC